MPRRSLSVGTKAKPRPLADLLGQDRKEQKTRTAEESRRVIQHFARRINAARSGRKPRTWGAPSVVYFIRCAEAARIKIGTTTNLERRLASIQAGTPLRIELLVTLTGDSRIEKKIHAQFAHLRVHGEWFEAAPDLLEYIDGLVS